MELHHPTVLKTGTYFVAGPKVVKSRRKASLQKEVRANVEKGSNVFSDALKSYDGLEDEYVHGVVNHAEEYVRGNIHTNGLENFWSLLKRAIKGIYVSVEPFHLFRYLDEQTFRFNRRRDKDNDRGRFLTAAKAVFGERLTYAELTGHADPQTS